MSQIVTYILVILIWDFLRLSAALFAKPDLSNPLIPVKWNEMCGYQSIKVQFFEKLRAETMSCFVDSTKVRQIGPDFMRHISPQNRILNGTEVKYRESPWTVQLTKRADKKWYQWPDVWPQYDYWCTGVLITMQHILTAAHCWEDGIVIRIFAGSDRSADHKNWFTDKHTFYQHPKYDTGVKNSDGTKIYNDDYNIGVIVLETPIDWERYGREKDRHELSINTICLPLIGKPDYYRDRDYSQDATIFGWGRIKGNKYPEILQTGEIKATYCCYDLHFVLDYMNRPRMCKGDSGSGLVQYLDESRNRAVLIGILTKARLKQKLKETSDVCDEETVGFGEAIRLNVPDIMNWIYEMLKK